jgi:integrase
MPEWIKSKYKGLWYRESDTVILGVGRYKRPKRYYRMTYKWEGKTISEVFGWEGEYIKNEEKAYDIYRKLSANRKDKTPPFTLAEFREQNEIALALVKKRNQEEAAQNVSFEDVFSGYIIYSKNNKRSAKSWQREEQLTRIHIIPVIKNTLLRKIAQIHMERIKRNMADFGLTPATIRYALAVVRQVFNYAIREGLFTGQNPAAGGKVIRPQEDNKKSRFLTHAEADLLLLELARRSKDVCDMAMLSLYTGMRFGEVAKLKWADVDLFQGIIMLRNTKSGKNRPAFMTPRVQDMIARRGPEEPDQLLFPARGTKNTVRARTSNIFYDVVGRLFNQGISDKKQWVNFHTLRHSFASWLVEEGTNIYLVKDLLGHSDLKLTERYAHIGQNQLKQAVMKLQNS